MARRLIDVSDWMSDDDRSTRVQGSCGGGCTEVRLSLEKSRSDVGKNRSSRGFQETVASFARDRLALATNGSIGLCEI